MYRTPERLQPESLVGFTLSSKYLKTVIDHDTMDSIR